MFLAWSHACVRINIWQTPVEQRATEQNQTCTVLQPVSSDKQSIQGKKEKACSAKDKKRKELETKRGRYTVKIDECSGLAKKDTRDSFAIETYLQNEMHIREESCVEKQLYSTSRFLWSEIQIRTLSHLWKNGADGRVQVPGWTGDLWYCWTTTRELSLTWHSVRNLDMFVLCKKKITLSMTFTYTVKTRYTPPPHQTVWQLQEPQLTT